MIVMSDGGGLWEMVKRVLGWGDNRIPLGPPPENTADAERVVQASKEVTDRAERAEKMVREFTDRQRREVDALKARVRYYERHGGGE